MTKLESNMAQCDCSKITTAQSSVAVYLNSEYFAVGYYRESYAGSGMYNKGVVRIYSAKNRTLISTIICPSYEYADRFGNHIWIQGDTIAIAGYYDSLGKFFIFDIPSATLINKVNQPNINWAQSFGDNGIFGDNGKWNTIDIGANGSPIYSAAVDGSSLTTHTYASHEVSTFANMDYLFTIQERGWFVIHGQERISPFPSIYKAFDVDLVEQLRWENQGYGYLAMNYSYCYYINGTTLRKTSLSSVPTLLNTVTIAEDGYSIIANNNYVCIGHQNPVAGQYDTTVSVYSADTLSLIGTIGVLHPPYAVNEWFLDLDGHHLAIGKNYNGEIPIYDLQSIPQGGYLLPDSEHLGLCEDCPEYVAPVSLTGEGIFSGNGYEYVPPLNCSQNLYNRLEYEQANPPEEPDTPDYPPSEPMNPCEENLWTRMGGIIPETSDGSAPLMLGTGSMDIEGDAAGPDYPEDNTPGSGDIADLPSSINFASYGVLKIYGIHATTDKKIYIIGEYNHPTNGSEHSIFKFSFIESLVGGLKTISGLDWVRVTPIEIPRTDNESMYFQFCMHGSLADAPIAIIKGYSESTVLGTDVYFVDSDAQYLSTTKIYGEGGYWGMAGMYSSTKQIVQRVQSGDEIKCDSWATGFYKMRMRVFDVVTQQYSIADEMIGQQFCPGCSSGTWFEMAVNWADSSKGIAANLYGTIPDYTALGNVFNYNCTEGGIVTQEYGADAISGPINVRGEHVMNYDGRIFGGRFYNNFDGFASYKPVSGFGSTNLYKTITTVPYQFGQTLHDFVHMWISGDTTISQTPISVV